MDKVLTQVEEIEAICRRLGITRDELAVKAQIKTETLRKVAKGYQPASERMMNSIRAAEKIILLLSDREPTERSKVDPSAPYRFMETGTLQRNLNDLTAKLETAAQNDRKHILGNLRAMLNELDERELTEAQKIAKAVGDEYDVSSSRAHSGGTAPKKIPMGGLGKLLDRETGDSTGKRSV